jgi:hypothetical protein
MLRIRMKMSHKAIKPNVVYMSGTNPAANEKWKRNQIVLYVRSILGSYLMECILECMGRRYVKRQKENLVRVSLAL